MCVGAPSNVGTSLATLALLSYLQAFARAGLSYMLFLYLSTRQFKNPRYFKSQVKSHLLLGIFPDGHPVPAPTIQINWVPFLCEYLH